MADMSLFPEFLRNCDRTRKVLFRGNVAVWFHPFPLPNRSPHLIIYAAAGYSTLPDSSSIGSFVICFGIPVSRDGIIQLQAHHVAWQARGMKRVARSSLAAEAVARSASIDFGYWIRAVYIDILFGSFGYSQFNAIRPTPLVIPFEYEQDHKIQYFATSKEVFFQPIREMSVWIIRSKDFLFFSR